MWPNVRSGSGKGCYIVAEPGESVVGFVFSGWQEKQAEPST